MGSCGYHFSPDPTPLSLACAAGLTDIARLLIDRKANLKIKVGNGMTVLHSLFALHQCEKVETPNALQVAELLLQSGLSANAKCDYAGCPLLVHAAVCASTSMISLLLKHRADIQSRSDSQGASSLHFAVVNGNTSVIPVLLSMRADPNARNNSLETPLHCATKLGRTACIEALRRPL